mgnify:CR=1 FL=1
MVSKNENVLISKLLGREVISLNQDNTIYDAINLLAKNNIGALPVVKNQKILCGIISERDYARKVILKDKSSRQTLVKEIMSNQVMCVDKSRTPEECMSIMINKRVRHLPVLEDEKMVGLLSIGDIVKAIIDEKEFVIEQLVTYIKDVPHISK